MDADSRGRSGGPSSRLPELLALHALPTAHMDATWWQPDWLPNGLFERLTQYPRCHRHLSRFFLKRTGHIDASLLRADPAHVDLALIPRQRLNRLIFLAGVTLMSPAIARTVRGSDRRRIRDGIGEADYEFALRRGHFLLQQARLDSLVEGIGSPDFSGLDNECRRLGVAGLAAALQDAPQALIRCTRLKLPMDLAERHWQPLNASTQACLRLFRLLGRPAGTP